MVFVGSFEERYGVNGTSVTCNASRSRLVRFLFFFVFSNTNDKTMSSKIICTNVISVC